MSSLHIRPHAPDATGTVLDVTPASAGWTHVGFKLVRLVKGQSYRGGEVGREVCLVLVSGRADVMVDDLRYVNLGGRTSPFEDRAPGALYLPAGVKYEVVALNSLELAICSAPGTGAGQARVIDEVEMSREVRGSGGNTRYVRNILPQDRPAESLLVVEVITPGGNWSSYPPHKHDTATSEQETVLEETYYHRIHPAQGFAFQRVYTSDRSIDETIAVEDASLVMVPRGYHPVGAAHGYDLYYLNVMAGPERRWIFCNDPDHAWIVNPSSQEKK